MKETDTEISTLNLTITPLTNLSVEWIIPIEVLKGKQNFSLPLVTFKYVLAEVLHVPVPLSYKAVKIENEIFECGLLNGNSHIVEKLSSTVKKDFKENYFLEVDLKSISELIYENYTAILIQYISKEIVNTDGIFFKVVFPVVNTNDSLLAIKINFNAQFSYGIRRYKFYTMYFN